MFFVGNVNQLNDTSHFISKHDLLWKLNRSDRWKKNDSDYIVTRNLNVEYLSSFGRWGWWIARHFDCLREFFFQVNTAKSKAMLERLWVQVQNDDEIIPVFKKAVATFNSITNRNKINLTPFDPIQATAEQCALRLGSWGEKDSRWASNSTLTFYKSVLTSPAIIRYGKELTLFLEPILKSFQVSWECKNLLDRIAQVSPNSNATLLEYIKHFVQKCSPQELTNFHIPVFFINFLNMFKELDKDAGPVDLLRLSWEAGRSFELFSKNSTTELLATYSELLKLFPIGPTAITIPKAIGKRLEKKNLDYVNRFFEVYINILKKIPEDKRAGHFEKLMMLDETLIASPNLLTDECVDSLLKDVEKHSEGEWKNFKKGLSTFPTPNFLQLYLQSSAEDQKFILQNMGNIKDSKTIEFLFKKILSLKNLEDRSQVLNKSLMCLNSAEENDQIEVANYLNSLVDQDIVQLCQLLKGYGNSPCYYSLIKLFNLIPADQRELFKSAYLTERGTPQFHANAAYILEKLPANERVEKGIELLQIFAAVPDEYVEEAKQIFPTLTIDQLTQLINLCDKNEKKWELIFILATLKPEFWETILLNIQELSSAHPSLITLIFKASCSWKLYLVLPYIQSLPFEKAKRFIAFFEKNESKKDDLDPSKLFKCMVNLGESLENQTDLYKMWDSFYQLLTETKANKSDVVFRVITQMPVELLGKLTFLISKLHADHRKFIFNYLSDGSFTTDRKIKIFAELVQIDIDFIDRSLGLFYLHEGDSLPDIIKIRTILSAQILIKAGKDVPQHIELLSKAIVACSTKEYRELLFWSYTFLEPKTISLWEKGLESIVKDGDWTFLSEYLIQVLCPIDEGYNTLKRLKLYVKMLKNNEVYGLPYRDYETERSYSCN